MDTNNGLNKTIGWVLASAATVFILLLAGVASGALTDDPPAVSPYATGSNDGSADTPDATSATSAAAATTLASTASSTAITISDFAFGEPAAAAVGGEVTVTNTDATAHTWTARDGTFDSGSLGGGDSFVFVFDTAGEYGFFCSIHPSMTGSISVTG